MPSRPLPPRDKLSILFGHGAYRMAARFAARNTGIAHVQAWSGDELRALAPAAHVICVSMLWNNGLIGQAPNLAFVQSISAGMDQYDRALFAQAGIRLAGGAGVNARAVAEHAMALILALKRQLHTGRDNQSAAKWRGMISNIADREDELGGKTVVLVGLGRIGARFAQLAKAFDLEVIAVRRDPAQGAAGADEVVATARLGDVLPRADIVVLACALTSETENLIDAAMLARLKPSAMLINVARGRVVDETALVAALAAGRLASAGLDVTREEPLPATSPLWSMPNVLLTPHTAGETQAYEDNVIDILLENLARLGRGETALVNGVV